MRNLAKALKSPRYHPPRRWRSKEESEMMRRFAFWWYTCRDRNKPSGREWARRLGISHTWLQKLVRHFQADPTETQREMLRHGDPTLEHLNRAQESTQRMRYRGELRSPRLRVPPAPPAIEPAMERFVKERFAQGWSKSRLVRELFLDRRTVARICPRSKEPIRDLKSLASLRTTREQKDPGRLESAEKG